MQNFRKQKLHAIAIEMHGVKLGVCWWSPWQNLTIVIYRSVALWNKWGWGRQNVTQSVIASLLCCLSGLGWNCLNDGVALRNRTGHQTISQSKAMNKDGLLYNVVSCFFFLSGMLFFVPLWECNTYKNM